MQVPELGFARGILMTAFAIQSGMTDAHRRASLERYSGRRGLTTIAVCLATLAPVTARAPLVPFCVDVVAPRDVTDSLVTRICAEAERIWAPTGVRLECRRGVWRDEAERPALVVTIDDREAPADGADAIGWLTFTSDGPSSLIHLLRSAAEHLLRNTPGLNDATIASHETLIGRALGRTLAHELGHYFFQSKLHTPHGLMRAAWNAQEIFSFDHRGFDLTVQQQATAVAYLQSLGPQ
jgi:hypothetical protein